VAIYLIRHGQSEGNAQELFQGQLDFALTPLGEDQARAFARWLKQQQVPWRALISSPLKRALQTAQLIAAEAGLPAPLLDPRLKEYCGGEMEGLGSAQIEARWPDYKDRPLDGRGDFSRFGGESYDAMQHRLGQFIAHYREQFTAEDNVAVVAHGGSLYQLFKLWCAWPTPRHFFNHIGNCCCFKLELCEVSGHKGARLQWMLPLELTGGQSTDSGNAAIEARVEDG
jgi:broad specificity phosphatase PhoE